MVPTTLLLAVALLKGPVTDSLIAELGSDQFFRREQASLALQRLALLAYPRLTEAAKSRDPEVKRRAEDLIRPHQEKALARAAERQVVIHAPERPSRPRHLGTIVTADGEECLVLTDTTVAAACWQAAVVEWEGKHYTARIELRDEDVGLALMSIRCPKKLTPLRLATGPTRGVWLNERLDLGRPFKEDLVFPGLESEDSGAGVFSLDEPSLEIRLSGVYGYYRKDPPECVTCTPGPEKIRRFLTQWEEKLKKRERAAPNP